MTKNSEMLIALGIKAFKRGDYQGAVNCFEKVVSQARELNLIDLELESLAWLPVAWHNSGHYQKMVETATYLMLRARQLRNEHYQMQAGLRLSGGMASLDLRGYWPQIQTVLLDGLAVARRLGDTFYLIYHLMQLGRYAALVDEVDEGYSWLQDALSELTPDMERRSIPRCLFPTNIYGGFSIVMYKQKIYDEAVRYAHMGLTAAQRDGQPHFIVCARLDVARAEEKRGGFEAALTMVDMVLTDPQLQGWRGVEQESLYLKAKVLSQIDQATTALPIIEQALEMALVMEMKEDEVKCLLVLGQVLVALEQQPAGLDTLQKAHRLSQERNYPDHFEKAETLLKR